MALDVNGKVPTIYAVLGLGYGWSACACPPSSRSAGLRRAGREGCQGQGGISLQRWNLLGVAIHERFMVANSHVVVELGVQRFQYTGTILRRRCWGGKRTF